MRMHWVGRVAAVIVGLLFATACGTIYSQPGRSYPNYPSGGGVYRGGGYVDGPYQRGIDDGHRRGFDAARDGHRFDPRRESWYRSADRRTTSLASLPMQPSQKAP